MIACLKDKLTSLKKEAVSMISPLLWKCMCYFAAYPFLPVEFGAIQMEGFVRAASFLRDRDQPAFVRFATSKWNGETVEANPERTSDTRDESIFRSLAISSGTPLETKSDSTNEDMVNTLAAIQPLLDSLTPLLSRDDDPHSYSTSIISK